MTCIQSWDRRRNTEKSDVFAQMWEGVTILVCKLAFSLKIDFEEVGPY